MILQNWAQTDGDYSGTATADGVTVVARTRETLNETGAACYALDIVITRGDTTQTFTAPGTFFRPVDWAALADRYAQRALAGKTGEDLFAMA